MCATTSQINQQHYQILESLILYSWVLPVDSIDGLSAKCEWIKYNLGFVPLVNVESQVESKSISLFYWTYSPEPYDPRQMLREYQFLIATEIL